MRRKTIMTVECYVIKVTTRGHYGDELVAAFLAFENSEIFEKFAEMFNFIKCKAFDVLPEHHVLALFHASGGNILTPTHVVELDLGKAKKDVWWKSRYLLMLKSEGVKFIPTYSIDKSFKPYDGSYEIPM
jgi:hypothetical protein